MSSTRAAFVAAIVCVAAAGPARAGSHLWVVNEIFSNADGSVQFIEMHVPTSAADETNLGTRWVLSTATTNQFDFPGNLPAGSTAFAYLLLATQSFADLPGAPTPDHIVPEGFFNPDQDDLEYWLYATGDMAFTSGQLPHDGVTSLQRDFSTAVNSPTNFAGETGSVDLSAVAAPEIGATAAAAPFLGVRPSGAGAFRIEFELPAPAQARVAVLDVAGRSVRPLFDGMASGRVHLTWDGRNASDLPIGSGVYFVALDTDGGRVVRKATVVR